MIRVLFGLCCLCGASNVFTFTLTMTGDNATNGASAVDSSCSINGEASFTSDGSRTVYSNEESYSGNMSIKMTARGGSTGFGSFGGIVDFRRCTGDAEFKLQKGDEIWLRSRILVPGDWEFNSGRNKFLRLRTYHESGGEVMSDGYNDLYIDGHPEKKDFQPFHFIYEGEHRWYGMGTIEDDFVRDQWKTVEWYLYLDDKKASQGGNATVRVWVDGILIGETFERITLKYPTSYISNLNFFTYYGNERSPKDQSVYVDDVVITTDQPLTKDEAGNRFIGIGEPSTRSEPKGPNPVTYSVD